jgi:hypothetical protein
MPVRFAQNPPYADTDHTAAGLCVQNPVKQSAILQLLESTLDITKFPPKTLLNDLAKYWRAES